jgi:hypothetical protein
MEGILVATAARPQRIYFDSFEPLQDFRTTMMTRKVARKLTPKASRHFGTVDASDLRQF